MRVTIPLDSLDEAQALLGIGDRNAHLLRETFQVAVTVRKGALHLDGEDQPVAAAKEVVDELLERVRRGEHIDPDQLAAVLKTGDEAAAHVRTDPAIMVNRAGRTIQPRSDRQRDYVEAMDTHDVVFGIGPAGTGKTYLAVAMAVRMLREGRVKKLILTRPAVEAGEKLGFLPGTFEAKVNPYLRPLYDALYDMVDPAQIRKFAENDLIEIAPLAYMRGRTLSDAFVILDEGQNTTPAQMKMFLTRMGEGSRMAVTGDLTQVDLPTTSTSGLFHAARLLDGVKGIRVCRFTSEDIVRHPVVQRIVDAYELENRAGRGHRS